MGRSSSPLRFALRLFWCIKVRISCSIMEMKLWYVYVHTIKASLDMQWPNMLIAFKTHRTMFWLRLQLQMFALHQAPEPTEARSTTLFHFFSSCSNSIAIHIACSYFQTQNRIAYLFCVSAFRFGHLAGKSVKGCNYDSSVQHCHFVWCIYHFSKPNHYRWRSAFSCGIPLKELSLGMVLIKLNYKEKQTKTCCFVCKCVFSINFLAPLLM